MKFKNRREAMIHFGFDPDTELIYSIPKIDPTKAAVYGLERNKLSGLGFTSHRPPANLNYIVYSFEEVCVYDEEYREVCIKQSFIQLNRERVEKWRSRYNG